MSSKDSKSTTSSPTANWVYDVFLSFRGEDTRKNFVSHLYKALDQKGIFTFKDDETLPRGEEIEPKILQAIKNSRFVVVVFSENYASSRWCLDELEMILECWERIRQTVLPIFYGMDPSNLTSETGSYAKALGEHEETYKDKLEMVKRWRRALSKAADISGWDSRNSKDETELIEDIIKVVSEKLPSTSSSGNDNLVRIDFHMRGIRPLLDLHSDDVRFLGIWGMGGVGKTTIAQAVYNHISAEFEGFCFIENVKESYRNLPGASLRNQLLCQILHEKNPHRSALGSSDIKDRLGRKKVLIVLDDVDHLDQLQALAGKHDWFGHGSRVIITTRDKHLLTAHGVSGIYEVKTLGNDDALRLFSQHAFKQEHPAKEFCDLAYRAVDYARGLPLALKVLGSFLFGRTKPQWEDKLIELKSSPNVEVQNVLRISFDGLQRNEREIFLDIACFYKGEPIDYVRRVLDAYGFCPVVGMEVLIEKCLITVSNSKVWMHDLLQEVGWEIVRSESIKEPWKRSRLWIYEDVCNALAQKTGSNNVEGLVIDLSKAKDLRLSVEALSSMKNLRLLMLCNAHIPSVFEYHHKRSLAPRSKTYAKVKEFEQLKHTKVHLSVGLQYLSQELRCLFWHGYPLTSLPLNFHAENLLELDLSYSRIQQLWYEEKCLNKLEFLDLSQSEGLLSTPNFEKIPNLKTLILEGCTSLVQVHPSIGELKMLAFINMKGCKSIKNVSDVIRLESLQTFILSGCSSLQRFPEVVRKMEHLLELHVDGTAIEALPSSIWNLSGLLSLNLKDCKNLQSLPESICSLRTLRLLILVGCTSLKMLPNHLGKLQNLTELDVGGTCLTKLPRSITSLTNLTRLSMDRCGRQVTDFDRKFFWSLGSSLDILIFRKPPAPALTTLHLLKIPKVLNCLRSLEDLDLSNNSFSHIPFSLSQLQVLEYLRLNNCKNLTSLPKLPASIAYVYANSCTSLTILSGTYESEEQGFVSDIMAVQDWDFRSFFFTNCFKLSHDPRSVEPIVVPFLRSQLRSLLKRQLWEKSAAYAHVKIIIPGNCIPSWFIHTAEESSITQTICSGSELMGLALCIVCNTEKHQDSGNGSSMDIFVEFSDGYSDVICDLQFDKPVEQDHLGICYVAFPNDWRSSNGDITVSLRQNEHDMLVKRLGMRLIYSRDAMSVTGPDYHLAAI